MYFYLFNELIERKTIGLENYLFKFFIMLDIMPMFMF